MLSYYFSSCESNNVYECETCEQVEPKIINQQILGKSYKMKVYDSENDYHFMYKNQDNFTNFQSIFNELNISINSANIVSVVFYTANSNYKTENNYDISQSDIQGILIYESRNDKIYSSVYIKTNDIFTKKSIFSDLTTRIVSATDINLISRLSLEETKLTSITFINFKLLPSKDLKYDELQTVIDTERINLGIQSTECGLPCNFTTKDQRCTAQERENGPESWFCFGKPCPKEEIDEPILDSPEPVDEQFEPVQKNRSLRTFRDNYLLGKIKGRNLVNLYYSLSIPENNLTLVYCREAIEIIDNTVLPMTQDLMNNPNSQIILINNTDSVKIINFLNKTKKLYISNSQKEKIDFIISEVNTLTSKTNYQITKYLEN
ncbi:hypothetical protein AMR72_14120 [Flavobacterium psychrophilum]|nr:hypothetical protein AMR72_14120 [Flavobacterium psychrophilum]AOE53556.1 hypothetical protein ALW18_14110 [Flavobacterium psychrophilum]